MGQRIADLVRALRAFDIELRDHKKGAHPWKATGKSRVDGTTQLYPIPAHNGSKTEVRDCYIRGVAQKFGLDEDELRALMGCPKH